jgi:hypothetical protein
MCHRRVMLLVLIGVSGVIVIFAAIASSVRKRTPRDGPIREPAKWSLRLRPVSALGPGDAYIECELELPSELWQAKKRLWLIITAEDGREWRNTFDALDQPEGMSISPAFDSTPPAPIITRELLANFESHGSASTTEQANVALLGLPSGTHRYAARAQLDELTSNSVSLSITGS